MPALIVYCGCTKSWGMYFCDWVIFRIFFFEDCLSIRNIGSFDVWDLLHVWSHLGPRIQTCQLSSLTSQTLLHAGHYCFRYKWPNGMVWGIWTKTCGRKECFNCTRNDVIQSLMWSTPTVWKCYDAIVLNQMLRSDWST